MSDAIETRRIQPVTVPTPELKLASDFFVAEKYTPRMTDENWRALRRTGIGGSDAGPVMGLSESRDSLVVYMSKVAEDSFQGNEYTDYGTIIEEALRATFLPTALVRRGVAEDKFKVYKSPWFYRSSICSWMVANIDGVLDLDVDTVDDDGSPIPRGRYLLELKAPGWRMAAAWGPGSAPDDYYAQVQHYQEVLKVFDGAVLFALVDRKPVLKFVPYNKEFVDLMVDRERDLWLNHVVPQMPPAPTVGSELVQRILGQMFSAAVDDELVEADEAESLVVAYAEISERVKELTAQKEKLEAELKYTIGDAKGIKTAAGQKAVWSRWQGTYFDQSQFKSDYPDLAARYVKHFDASRLTVSQGKK